MKKLIAFCLLALITLASSAQFTLKGIVLDDKGNPINKATLQILNTQYAAVSDEQGKFLIENISIGKYILNVSSIGHATINRQINMGDGPNGIEIVLQPSFKQLSEVIISTEKRDKLQQNIPVSITALSSTQVEDYRLWNINDLTSVSPNLYTAD
ncbi:MAG: carboxypeptidase-like regulatory domain-containing protein, partial [Bacteroidota bacterium]|nr:carboxypeptidase-like regulatory domain-containing protein [Bacteroidota bacterium]